MSAHSAFATPRAAQLRAAAEAVPGLRTLLRPAFPDTASDLRFPLTYVRTGSTEHTGTPLVVIPGGPGLASALPYAAFRATAKSRGLDVLMVEHRGVGLSRRTGAGTADEPDLPREAMRLRYVLDDLRAVLDAEGIDRAVVVGSSYGTYVAQAFAHAHPDRVAGLVLDSPMLAAGNLAETSWAEALLYDGSVGDAVHRQLAGKVRDLAAGCEDAGELGRGVRIVFEFAGPGTLDAFLNQRALGADRLTSNLLTRLAQADTGTPVPCFMEFDLVGEIAFRELDYAGVGNAGEGNPGEGDACVCDSGEGDTGVSNAGASGAGVGDAGARGAGAHGAGGADARRTDAGTSAHPDSRAVFSRTQDFAELAREYSPFCGEELDLEASLAELDVPVVVLSGDRDLRTPRPVAARIAALAPLGLLLTVPHHGHSALDTHHEVLLAAMQAAAAEAARADAEAAAETGTQAQAAGSAGRSGGLDSLGDPADVGETLVPEAGGGSAMPQPSALRRWNGAHTGGGPSARMGVILRAVLAADRLLPRRRRAR